MGRYGNLDSARLTKIGVVLGLSLFFIGAGGEWLINSWQAAVPAWGKPLFFDLEILGLLAFFVSPFLFGILLPLTE